MTKKRIARSLLVGYFAFLVVSWNVVAWAQSDTVFLPIVASAAADEIKVPPTATPAPDQDVIDRALSVNEIADWLAQNAGWQGNVYQTDEGANIWQVDFCSGEDCSEWLGYAQVNRTTGEVVNYFVPRTLSTEEFAEGKAKVENYVKYDPEVQSRMENPDLWYHETDWNRWEQVWEATYTYGLDAFAVRLSINKETGKVEFNSIINPNEMEAAAKEQERLDRARQLIWEAEGVGEAVDGYDTIKTYAEHQKDNLYTVSFVADGKQLYSALVDVEAGAVLEGGR